MPKKKVSKAKKSTVKKSESFDLVKKNNDFRLLLLFAFFVALVAVFLGFRSKEVNQGRPENLNTVNQRIASSSPEKEALRESIKRCGDFPENIPPGYGDINKTTGPLWSPDCKHIAWSLWEGLRGIGLPEGVTIPLPSPEIKPSKNEGVFIYSKATQKITQVYTPKTKSDTAELSGWKGNDSIIYATSEKDSFIYNLTTKKTEKK